MFYPQIAEKVRTMHPDGLQDMGNLSETPGYADRKKFLGTFPVRACKQRLARREFTKYTQNIQNIARVIYKIARNKITIITHSYT